MARRQIGSSERRGADLAAERGFTGEERLLNTVTVYAGSCSIG